MPVHAWNLAQCMYTRWDSERPMRQKWIEHSETHWIKKFNESPAAMKETRWTNERHETHWKTIESRHCVVSSMGFSFRAGFSYNSRCNRRGSKTRACVHTFKYDHCWLPKTMTFFTQGKVFGRFFCAYIYIYICDFVSIHVFVSKIYRPFRLFDEKFVISDRT